MPTKKYTKPELRLPPDIRRRLSASESQDVRTLASFVDEMGVKLEQNLLDLSGNVGDATRVIYKGKPIGSFLSTVTETATKTFQDTPKSFPKIPVSFIGNYTDEFTSTDGLSGIFDKGAVTPAMSASGGILTLSAASGSTAYVYAGRDGGAFLNGGGTWTVETILGDGDYNAYNGAGICIAKQTFADDMSLGSAGFAKMYAQTYSGPTYRVYYADATYSYDALAKAPSAADPLYLKISHTFDGTDHTFVYTYKFESDGSYTTLHTSVIADTSYPWNGALCDTGPYMYLSTASPISYTYNSIEVNYTPMGAVPYDKENFIPITTFSGFIKDYVYARQYDKNGTDTKTWKKIVPTTDMEVFDTDSDTPKYWSGSAWTTRTHVLADTSSLGALHTVSGLTSGNILRATGATTAAFGTINLFSSDSVISTGTDGKLPLFDIAGQLKDSAYSPASFEASGSVATHSALDTGVHGVGASDVAATGFVLALLSQLPAIFPTHTYAAATYLTLAGAATTYLPLAGGTMAGNIAMATYNISNIGALGVTGDITKTGNGAIYHNSVTGGYGFFIFNEVDVPGAYFAANYTWDEFLLVLGAPCGNQVVIGGAYKDYDHASQTNPTLFIHSATDPDSDNTEWVSLTHDQTDAIIGVGKGKLKTAAEVNIGDGTNYLDVATNGFITAHGTAVAYKDDNAAAVGLAKGASAPTLIQLNATNIYVNAFDGGATSEQLFWAKEVNHDYEEGTDITFHVHWMPTTGDAGNVKWFLDYVWINPGGTVGAATTLSVVSAASTTAWAEQRSDFTAISGAGKTIGSQLFFRFYRTPADGSDTYAHDAAAITVGYHYKVNTLGSASITAK